MTIRVAVIDSGINAVHSHVGRVVDGVDIELGLTGELIWQADYRDRIGHGTAVAGLIHLLAPEAELLAVRIVAADGRSSAVQMAAAIGWALANGVHLFNLSLGTANPDDADILVQACRAAVAGGGLVVAAAPSREGPPMWPACLPDVIGVRADHGLGPDAIGYDHEHAPPWRALGEPRALPGPQQAHNFKGSSFAAARVTGLLAREASRQGAFDALWLLDWMRSNGIR